MPVSIIIIEYPADTVVKIHQGQKNSKPGSRPGQIGKNDRLYLG